MLNLFKNQHSNKPHNNLEYKYQLGLQLIKDLKVVKHFVIKYNKNYCVIIFFGKIFSDQWIR